MTELAGLPEGGPSAFDRALAGLLAARSAPETCELVRATALLLAAARRAGHACVLLPEWAGRPLPWAPSGEEGFPAVDRWRSLLEASGVAGDGRAPVPVVVDGERCYLYRYFRAECAVAEQVRARLESAPAVPAVGVEARRLFADMFGATASTEPDRQALAAATALAGRLALISGGPGTGKTTVIARFLLLLAALEPEQRIALAAPTGKAAARLGEAVRAEVERLGARVEHLRARIPAEAKTLHRLLGAGDEGFRYGPGSPLPVDTVVVDEASMVDLVLMEALLAAVPKQARLVLVGDKDQLASVETGVVFGDLCAAAVDAASGSPGYAPAVAGLLESLGGGKVPVRREPAGLADAFVELERNYRFGPDSGIGELARAIREGNAERVMEVLAEPRFEDAAWRGEEVSEELLADFVLAPLERAQQCQRPEQALEEMLASRILCGLRQGPRGVEGICARVERRAAQTGRGWIKGRPVLITVNDYHLSLYNGDVGIGWWEEGRPVVSFPGASGRTRSFSPSLLPAHELAWAMTVHKAQGSEFDRVALVLPSAGNPLLTRELLYTGVTRARHRIEVVGSEAAIKAAVTTPHRRRSGLRDRLRGA